MKTKETSKVSNKAIESTQEGISDEVIQMLTDEARSEIFDNDDNVNISKTSKHNRSVDIYIAFENACDGILDYVEPTISNCTTLQMGVTKLLFDEKENILHVYVRRPGLLIGRSGSNIKKIEDYIGCKIHIHEVKQLWD